MVDALVSKTSGILSREGSIPSFLNILWNPLKNILWNPFLFGWSQKKKTNFCLLSFVFCLLSFVFCLLSFVFCLLSFVFCLLSFVFCRVLLPNPKPFKWVKGTSLNEDRECVLMRPVSPPKDGEPKEVAILFYSGNVSGNRGACPTCREWFHSVRRKEPVFLIFSTPTPFLPPTLVGGTKGKGRPLLFSTLTLFSLFPYGELKSKG